MSSSSSSSKFDPQPPDKSSLDATEKEAAKANETNRYKQAQGEGIPDVNFLNLISRADTVSKDYQARTIERPLSRSYRAWKNQHAEGSKYLGPAWRGRSRLFVPKTHSAVRKNMATAAAALFSTDDVVNISAQYEDDPIQMATAACIKQDLDYRLTRTSAKSGLPWFQIAMGACLDSQLTGICISKQFWEYEEVEKEEEVEVPILDVDGVTPIIDALGQPVIDKEMQTVSHVTRDRPMIELHPIENSSIDPAAPWHSPIQLGRWFMMKYPMGLDDAKSMMRSAEKYGRESGWLEVDDAVLLKGRLDEDRTGARRVREGGADRYEDSKSPGHLDIVWLQENFFRIDGIDWHFWSVGRHAIISEVRRVEDVYPEFGGERPYVMGMSTLDTHQVFPMSPVESWQPLQLELNDITNLRQDTLKRSIAPLAMAKRGKNVDLAQLQRRGQPDTVLLVDSLDDVAFQHTPGPSGASYTETSVNNAMFDELAGVFSTSSVQQSRQLNETVGGMKLMSGAANSVSEFDLRMWIETWVEPVIRQVAHLIRFYETDERLLALCNAKAQNLKKHQIEPTFEQWEEVELFVRVNAGIGASDPMQKLGKMKAAMEMLMPMADIMAKSGITVNAEAVIDEVMGSAGFRDGRRFFEFGEPPEDEKDPEMERFMIEMKQERDAMQLSFQEAMAKIQSDMAQNLRDNQTRLQVEQMKGKAQLGSQLVTVHASREARQEGQMEKRREQLAGVIDKTIDRRREDLASARAENSKFETERVQENSGKDQQLAVDKIVQALGQIDQRLQSVENREEGLMRALWKISEQLAATMSQRKGTEEVPENDEEMLGIPAE